MKEEGSLMFGEDDAECGSHLLLKFNEVDHVELREQLLLCVVHQHALFLCLAIWEDAE